MILKNGNPRQRFPFLLIVKVPAVLFQFQEIIPGLAITIFKTIIELLPSGRFYNMCKKGEIISQGK